MRNGSHQPREVLTSAGAVEVVAPRVNDRRIDPTPAQRPFASAILPAWCRRPRRSPRCCRCCTSRLSPGTSCRRWASSWQLGRSVRAGDQQADRDLEVEQRTFSARTCPVWTTSTSGRRHPRQHPLEEHKLCLLVMIGVRADGRKELVALTDGYRESTESWADLLRDCARRGMHAPVLAIGDGALVLGALREVFPQARTQRCWFHKIANVLGAAQVGASGAAGTRGDLERRGPPACPGRRGVRDGLRVKFPKAVAKITDDVEELLAFYDYPPSTGFTCARRIRSSHFRHVRHRTKITRGRVTRRGAGDGVQAHRAAQTAARSPPHLSRSPPPRRGRRSSTTGHKVSTSWRGPATAPSGATVLHRRTPHLP